MTKIEKLFDEKAIARALAKTEEKGQFLRIEIAERILDRLSEVNRAFSSICLITTDPVILKDQFKNADIISPYVNKDGLDGFLGLADSKYDLIISNLDLHRVNDPVGLLVQINKGLQPDGLFVGAMFAGDTLDTLKKALLKAEMDIKGGASPRIMPFADIRDLGSLLQRAGFALPVADMDRLNVSYESVMHLLVDLAIMGEGASLNTRSKGLTTPRLLALADRNYPREEDGRLMAHFDVAYLTGWHPHESQQKPLKPGSGKVNLADALKVGANPPKKEIKTGKD